MTDMYLMRIILIVIFFQSLYFHVSGQNNHQQLYGRSRDCAVNLTFPFDKLKLRIKSFEVDTDKYFIIYYFKHNHFYNIYINSIPDSSFYWRLKFADAGDRFEIKAKCQDGSFFSFKTRKLNDSVIKLTINKYVDSNLYKFIVSFNPIKSEINSIIFKNKKECLKMYGYRDGNKLLITIKCKNKKEINEVYDSLTLIKKTAAIFPRSVPDLSQIDAFYKHLKKR